MVDAATDCGVFAETVIVLSYFKALLDPRQQGKVEYPLDEILLLCLLAVLAVAETFVDIARFGRRKLGLLRRFRPFAEGTPAHDHLGDILAALDAGQFQRCFIAWVAALTAASEGVMAIDGKTVSWSHHKTSGEVAIEEATITIEARGCQREIAQKISDKKADYVLALKGNQGSLREDVEVFVAEQKAKGFKDTKISRDETVDGDHGRIETRTTTVIHDIAWLQDRHDWPGLKSLVIVDSIREIPGPSPGTDKIERETRFYITSLILLAGLLGPIIRSHWAIENSLHWVMDMVFRDDECRVRTEHAPANFCTIKHIAHNLIRKAPGKGSLRLKRKAAGWDDDFLVSLVAR